MARMSQKASRKIKAPERALLRRSHPSLAMTVAPPAPKPWELTADEVTILKNSICKGATDDELKYCLAVARRYELDPFRREIHFVPRWDSEAERTDGKKGAKLYVPVVGIDGLQHTAARDHSDYGSFGEVEYGPMITVEWTDSRHLKHTLQAPEWARIEAWKKGAAQPTVGKVWWNEIYPDVDRAPLVRRMPRLMLGKCARAQAIRAAYPKTGGLLTHEETYNREFTDITPGGRLITAPEPDNPHLQKYLEREKEELSKLTPAQREVLEQKMRKASEAEQHDSPSGKDQTASTVGDEPRRADTAVSDGSAGPVQAEMPASPLTLSVRHYLESDTYRILGAENLPVSAKKVLRPYWSKPDQAIVCNGEQLDAVKFELEKQGIYLRAE